MRSRLYDYFFLILLLAVLYGIEQLLAPFAGVLLAALVCAIMFDPLYHKLQRMFPHRSPTQIALFTDLLVFLLFITPFLLLTWAVIQESTAFGPVMQQWNSTIDQWKQGEFSLSQPWALRLRSALGGIAGMHPLQFQQSTMSSIGKSLGKISAWGAQAAANTLYFVFDLMIMLFTLFFLFRESDKIYNYFYDLIPMRAVHKERLMERIRDTAIGVSRGMILTCLAQGAASTIAYLIVGIEGAVLLGVLTTMSAMLPAIGTLCVWIPVGIFLMAKGSYAKGIFILIWGAVVVVGVIDTFVRPYLVGKKMQLPFLALFFALLGGIEVWGLKGLIIGPILVAVTPVLLQMYRERYLRSDGNAADESALS